MGSFAYMTAEQLKAASSKGGLAAHARGTARQWTTEQAREAANKSVAIRAGRKAVAKEEAAQRRSECYEVSGEVA